jgi:hypothetical protein
MSCTRIGSRTNERIIKKKDGDEKEDKRKSGGANVWRRYNH